MLVCSAWWENTPYLRFLKLLPTDGRRALPTGATYPQGLRGSSPVPMLCEKATQLYCDLPDSRVNVAPRYQGYIGAALVLGGVDVTGPHLYSIYPHGSTDKLPYVTMGKWCSLGAVTRRPGTRANVASYYVEYFYLNSVVCWELCRPQASTIEVVPTIVRQVPCSISFLTL